MEFFSPNIFEMGAVAVVAVCGFWVIYKIILGKKNNNKNGKLLEEVKQISSNHLNSIEKAIREEGEATRNITNQSNLKIIELLGEINGKLSK